MLSHLTIRNLAIVHEVTFDLGPGMNVITGETGAGKSVLVEALALVLGARARTDLLRRGCDRGGVEAFFSIPQTHAVTTALRAADLMEEESGEGPVDLLIRRELAVGRSGRTTINGHLVTLATLRRVAAGLMDIASQHQHVALRDRGAPMKLLDRLCDNGDIRDAYGEAWSALKRAQDNVDRLRSLGDERMEREDFVRFLLEELDEANLVSGEDEHLRERKDKLTHADTLTRGLGASERLLSTDPGSVTAGLAACLHTLSQLAELDPTLSPLHQRIDAARIEVDDVAYDLATHARDIGGDAGELERVQSRLHLVERLTRKHRVDLEGLLERRESLRAELGDMESLEDAVIEAEATLTSAAARAREVAEALSAARQTSARDLTKLVDKELRDLGMSGARVRFGITAREALCAEGQDEVILLAQTNPGEGFKPIDRVASGGELSRLLLAFKGALSCHDPVCVSVFDEVDTGVGGPTAEVLGRKLKSMAGNRQVLVVTHQPQIAMHAHQHLHVQKVGQRGRTVTRVRLLDARGRREEISRMLGGLTITAHVRQHAEELLAKGAAA